MRLIFSPAAFFALAVLLNFPHALSAVTAEAQEAASDTLALSLGFESDSDDLPDAARTEAAAFAASIRDREGLRLVITGYAAQTGDRLQDRHLALGRARALRQALLEAGFPRERTVLEARVMAPGAGASDASTRPQTPHRAEARAFAR